MGRGRASPVAVPGRRSLRCGTLPAAAPGPSGTHADGEHGPCPVHGVAVRARADVSHVLPGVGQPQLPPHELRERPHPVGAAANAHELQWNSARWCSAAAGTTAWLWRCWPCQAQLPRKERNAAPSPSLKGHWNTRGSQTQELTRNPGCHSGRVVTTLGLGSHKLHILGYQY